MSENIASCDDCGYRKAVMVTMTVLFAATALSACALTYAMVRVLARWLG